MDQHHSDALDGRMAHREEGSGSPTIVFLHGNPTSSYLWRNVMPHVSDLGRCLAPDLIGMGDSSKRDGTGDDRYRFVEHARYLDAWFDIVVPDGPVVLVVHDWGSALGFHWANRHRDRVAGIAHTESIVTAMAWDDWPEPARRVFQGMRSEAGDEMVLEKNIFVERILPAGSPAFIDDAAMDVYRRPFAEPGEARRPTLTWPRQIPLDGEPADVVAIVADYGSWLASDAGVPKLLVVADPGTILVGRQLAVAQSWPNQAVVSVEGAHFVPEHSPHELGEHLRDWLVETIA